MVLSEWLSFFQNDKVADIAKITVRKNTKKYRIKKQIIWKENWWDGFWFFFFEIIQNSQEKKMTLFYGKNRGYSERIKCERKKMWEKNARKNARKKYEKKIREKNTENDGKKNEKKK